MADQNNISFIPDTHSNNTIGDISKEENGVALAKSSNIDHLQRPSLFTFDLVPSVSEESFGDDDGNSASAHWREEREQFHGKDKSKDRTATRTNVDATASKLEP